jgi:uncharacterized protein (DUF2132 family)
MSDEQPNNLLHGVTLKAILEALVASYGWEGLAARIPVACFSNAPSLKSSLKFLRKTPWARVKVERLYLADQRQREKKRARNRRRAARRAFGAAQRAAQAPGEE